MRRAGLIGAVLAGLIPSGGFGESLVSTLSDDAVQITSNFPGEQIVVFGAVSGALPGNPGYEVAVVAQGPDQDVIVRRKERLLGIWANRTSRAFTNVPSFYVMHLSGNFSAAQNPAQLKEYRLGVRSLAFVQEAAADRTAEQFAEAAIQLKADQGLFAEKPNAVQFLAPNVFRTTFFLPSEIPTGEYRVSVYLFRRGAFLAGQTQSLRIEKGGFSDRIATYAAQLPLAYGLVCVGLAVATGWLAGLIFRRP